MRDAKAKAVCIKLFWDAEHYYASNAKRVYTFFA